MDRIPNELGAYYILDHAYLDTEQLYFIHKKGSFFVVREKRKMKFTIDYDREGNRTFVFYTNNQEIIPEHVFVNSGT